MTYKSILCLNGTLPKKAFFDMWQLPIIAADGAANKLCALGLAPCVAIGDLDSINTQLQIKCIHIEDQDRCDYEKSMEYLEENNLLPTIIVGIGGGDLDHVLNNMSIFMSNSSGNLLYADPLYGTVLGPSHTQIKLSMSTKVSILGLPKAQLITKGLEWDLTGQELSFPGFNSSLNRMREDLVHIEVLQGQALFLAHAFFSLQQTGSN